ncbi:MAG TPA: hypothetical protein VFR10_08525, partial [bacterium]|nr:hypothetical protein [bacterium]
MAKTSASLPKTTPPAPSEDRPEAFAFWSMVAITIGGAILLVAIGRGPAPDKAEAEVSAATDSTEPVKLPQPIEPIGIVETAPLQFRWTPGSDDVDLAQVIVFKGDMTRIWESAPTDSNVVSIPLHM